MKYTKDDHVKNVLKMLSGDNPCHSLNCPISFTVDSRLCSELGYGNLCRSFINLDIDSYCPCRELGKQEAIKRTWLALEEGGYI